MFLVKLRKSGTISAHFRQGKDSRMAGWQTLYGAAGKERRRSVRVAGNRRAVNGRDRCAKQVSGGRRRRSAGDERQAERRRRSAIGVRRRQSESPGVCRNDFSHKSLISAGLWRKNGNPLPLKRRLHDLLMSCQLTYALISAI